MIFLGFAMNKFMKDDFSCPNAKAYKCYPGCLAEFIVLQMFAINFPSSYQLILLYLTLSLESPLRKEVLTIFAEINVPGP